MIRDSYYYDTVLKRIKYLKKESYRKVIKDEQILYSRFYYKSKMLQTVELLGYVGGKLVYRNDVTKDFNMDLGIVVNYADNLYNTLIRSRGDINETYVSLYGYSRTEDYYLYIRSRDVNGLRKYSVDRGKVLYSTESDDFDEQVYEVFKNYYSHIVYDEAYLPYILDDFICQPHWVMDNSATRIRLVYLYRALESIHDDGGIQTLQSLFPIYFSLGTPDYKGNKERRRLIQSLSFNVLLSKGLRPFEFSSLITKVDYKPQGKDEFTIIYFVKTSASDKVRFYMSERRSELKMFFRAEAYVRLLSKRNIRALPKNGSIGINMNYYSINNAIYRRNFNELLVNFKLRKDIQEVKDKLERDINKVHDE